MGYSDLGCYGGEIDTPNLDKMAARGSRFTQFYNTARCSPSRASLLTGLHPHQCGIGVLTDDTGPEGYSDDLNQNCVTIAEVLRSAGYRTYMSGKWHMSHELNTPSDSWPNQRGFDEFYGTIVGAGSYFHPKSFIRNNEHIEQEAIDDDSFYYTDAISDQAVDYIKRQAGSDKPFFLYTAYTAPHWPLQARESDIERYKGRFDDGWDTLRLRRIERMREEGILADHWEMSPRDPAQTPWEQAENKDWQTRRMEVYAAQITVMDEGIGRIVDSLEETGQLEDTVIIFLADNGGCAEELSPGWLANRDEPFFYRGQARNGEPVRFGNDPEIVPGPENTYTSYGVPWANLSNTPFRMYKHWTHEGGIATPLIVQWQGGLKSVTGGLHHGPAQLPDVMATVFDITGAAYLEEYKGNPISPIEGESFLKTLKGGEYERGPLFWEHEGNAAMREGKWKLVRNFTGAASATPGFDPQGRRGKWELYDMDQDRTELNDLSESEPDRVVRMTAKYEKWAARCGVKDREKILANPPG